MILFTRNYIIDIWLGKAISQASNAETGSDGFYGRKEYLPPEIFQKQPYMQPSDVYCFTTLLWQLISRVPPWETAAKPPKKDTQYTFLLREELVPGMHAALQKIICDCWNPDPSERPTMRGVHSRLLEARSGLGDIFLGAETLAFITKRRADLEAADGVSFKIATSMYYTSNQLSKFTQ